MSEYNSDIWEQMRNAEQSCHHMEKKLDGIHASLDKMLAELDKQTEAANEKYGTELPLTRDEEQHQ